MLSTLDELATWIKGMDSYSSSGNKARYDVTLESQNQWFSYFGKGEPPVRIKHHKVNLLASFTQPTK